ncbi:helix-turn-helix domain-containing protein [Halosegnis marinus]|uniref:Helix-turn-helix domain-containing protein n=1 Tax=Halosegnis marinus TaxID=3034023 RepID=A0ABD5ZN44_9EURY|nr:helix-turn-helix domain-containing protein [Halosegnis sp. DT85]
MIDLTLDMQQYDCPFIDTTVDHDVAFSAVHWEFDSNERSLSTRMFVEGDDRGALENGLSALTDHEHMHDARLLSKQDAVAHVRTTIHETDAMATVRRNDGYVTGPFHIESGSELWHIGFDRESAADGTLASLDTDNDFDVVERSDLSLSDVNGFVRNVGAAMTLVEGCKDLSDTERRTLETAVGEGYFESPRGATLGDLADRFDVSKPAVSKTLRRGEGKLLSRAVDALDDIDEE